MCIQKSIKKLAHNFIMLFFCKKYFLFCSKGIFKNGEGYLFRLLNRESLKQMFLEYSQKKQVSLSKTLTTYTKRSPKIN